MEVLLMHCVRKKKSPYPRRSPLQRLVHRMVRDVSVCALLVLPHIA